MSLGCPESHFALQTPRRHVGRGGRKGVERLHEGVQIQQGPAHHAKGSGRAARRHRPQRQRLYRRGWEEDKRVQARGHDWDIRLRFIVSSRKRKDLSPLIECVHHGFS
eukprot:1264677-Pyramimonas_sp.AAC.1